ncbi:MAG: response regulator [Bryobacteraceae bacterium]|jgi:DNA-binding response OmpR family regulator
MSSGTTSNHPLPERSSENFVTVLSISPIEADHLFLRNVFSHSNWRVHGVRSRREAQLWLRRQYAPVVLCEERLPDCGWQEVLRELGSLQDPPALIVTSRLADEALWAEVLNLGAYDLLMKPFDLTEVFRVVSLAWRHWKNNWERARADSPWEGRRALSA